MGGGGRRIERALALVLASALAAAGCAGESRPESEGAASSTSSDAASLKPLRSGQFTTRGGVLYRVEGDELLAVTALPGAGVAPDTLENCAAAIPRLAEDGFRRLVASPDAGRAAWQTSGPGACVGVADAASGAISVLGRWSTAVPDSLVWAPRGGYLAVLLMHPDGRHSVGVFDAETGAELAMPWEADCEGRADCDVSRVKWLGGSLLNVEIRQGPAELSVPYEVNVGMAAAVTRSEES